ncbi:MAG: thiamine pyrophosphate-binding protein [Methanomicrobiales archaeon]|nr:thiamine pyrophosphate-binding protein [Methanomicrobiales archaeon]
MKCSVSELLLHYLKEAGTDYIFGVPGLTLEPFLISCKKSGQITPVLTKHEEGAAFMADGYARVRGTLGACFATSGPGATNLVSGVATSYTDETPVMVITGQIPTFTNRRGTVQDSTGKGIDSVELFRPITKASSVIISTHSAQYDIEQALSVALTGRKGPVHLSIPKDIQAGSLELAAMPSRYVPPSTEFFDRRLVIDAARELVRAANPVILAGAGAVHSGAMDDILDLAGMLNIPVATTPHAKGAIPEDHPLSLGVLGWAGSPAAEGYVKSGSVDVLLVIGSSLNQVTTLSWDPRIAPTRCLIHVNIDPTIIGVNYPTQIPLVGDAKTITNEISFRVLRDLESVQATVDAREKTIADEKARLGAVFEPEKMQSGAMPLKPQRLMADLQACLPENAIVFADVGNNLLWVQHYLKLKRPGSFFAPFGLLTMGYSVSAAIGGKLAAPDRPVIASVGDGDFFMNGMEVATAVNYDVPVVWIVHNNARLGLIHNLQSYTLGEETILTRFRAADFAAIARGLGAEGYTVTKPGELTEVLPKALATGRPAVIDCIIDPQELPPMGAFVKGAREYAERALL